MRNALRRYRLGFIVVINALFDEENYSPLVSPTLVASHTPPSLRPLSAEIIHRWWDKFVGYPNWVKTGSHLPRRRGIGSYTGRLENTAKKREVMEL